MHTTKNTQINNFSHLRREAGFIADEYHIIRVRIMETLNPETRIRLEQKLRELDERAYHVKKQIDEIFKWKSLH